MSEERALVKSEDFDVKGTALEVYGSRAAIREMVDRLMAFHPAAGEVGKEGMLGAAQLAFLVGASPLPSVNEIHVWKDKDDRTCIHLGVNYYRRRAHELGGVYWIDEPRAMTDEERVAREIPDGVYTGIARAARRDEVDRFVARMMGLARGASFKDVFSSGLEMHARTGIASVPRGRRTKNNRPGSWDALKGAEIDLFRQLFPNLEQKPTKERQIEMLEEIPKQGVDDDTLTMEEIEELARMRDRGDALDAEWEALSPEERQERGEAAGAAFYGRHDEDDPFGIDAKEEPLPIIDIEQAEEVAFGEEFPEGFVPEAPAGPDPEPDESPTCPGLDGNYCACGPVVPDESPESYIADRQDPAALEKPEPEPEPEPEYIPDPETLKYQLRSCARWIKDGSRPNKRLMGEESKPPDGPALKQLNAVLKLGLKGDGLDSKSLDDARRDLVQYVYGVRSTRSLTAKEAASLVGQFYDPATKQLRENAAADMWAMVIVHREEQGQQALPGM